MVDKLLIRLKLTSLAMVDDIYVSYGKKNIDLLTYYMCYIIILIAIKIEIFKII